MGKDINLNSEAWRDLVFEGKNKEYGAYRLRKTSSKRHVVALIVMLCFVGVVIALPYFIEAVKPSKENLGGVDDTFEMTNVQAEEEKKEEEVIPQQELAPPPPPVKASIQFTPPVVVEDSKVKEDNEIKTQEELTTKKDLQVSFTTNEEGSKEKGAANPEDLLKNKQITNTPTEVQKPFKVVEQMPTFKGGPAELMKYLANNIKYPDIAAQNNIEGKVIITFVVGKDGSISNVKVVKTLDPSCDREALRVVKAMPAWIPGRQNGQSVPVEYTLPVTFKLQK
ncbi:protein TonB [Dysgonomonas sp. PH5-45]|uniref:energy transducer TonB n=1 Tax=unclassified Dysgonomonas TaxID=2630389 RepID=UPI0024748B00|nr:MULTISPECIES: energy transducer TonB [unclassified Dysgonomonas]MDH6353999.1 protein TonB [Dysgonomonas sp. PH5-45]MDH6386901.1 protein TonB [Dysgonomonas sp. PH5-37]